MHRFPEATYAPSSSAGKPDKSGSDARFINLCNSDAADTCHKAFKKARSSLNYAMVMFGQNWEAVKGKGDQVAVGHQGADQSRSDPVAHPESGDHPSISWRGATENLKTIFGAIKKLEGDHLLPETKQAVENVIGVDASVDGEGEPGTTEKPTSKRRKASQHEDVDVTDVEKSSKPVKKGKTASK